MATLWSFPILNLYLIRAMNLADHMGFLPELIRIQYAFLATAPCSLNIRSHEDIVVLAIVAC